MQRPIRLPLQDLSRRGALTAFAIALAALVVTAGWFIHARNALGESFTTLGEQQRALAEANGRQQESQLRLQYAQSSRALMAGALQRGLRPAAWGERLINVRQAQFDRADATSLLATATRSRNTLFGAETFELSVTRPDESLFVAPPAPAAGAAPTPLSLSLSGSLLFRTGDGGAADAAQLAPPPQSTP